MFFIDGFNVYHSLIAKRKYHKYLWLNYHAFAQCFLKKSDLLISVLYFSAYPVWDDEKTKRHKLFVSALQNEGVWVIMNRFKDKEIFCKNCQQFFWSKEEKQTDVSIGVHLYKEAQFDNYDKAILVTNDTDLIPAIEIVKYTFPQKRLGILFPIDRHAAELKKVFHFCLYTEKRHLRKSQFPDHITLPSGVVLQRPPTWR